MHRRSGARTLVLGLVLGLFLGLFLVGVANQPHRGSTPTTAPPIKIHLSQTVYEFFAPRASGVECEMTMTSTLCITDAPPRRAVVSVRGAFTTCEGIDCLSNAGLDTPTLPANTIVDNDRFTCTVGQVSTTCVANGHGGFTISRGGIHSAQ